MKVILTVIKCISKIIPLHFKGYNYKCFYEQFTRKLKSLSMCVYVYIYIILSHRERVFLPARETTVYSL